VFNEPFGATWAEGKASDMDVFAARVAETVATHAPNWLIFVEGAARSPNCTSVIDGDAVSCGYGDNLLGAQRNASALDAVAQRGKLVWSPHTYGPSQHDRIEFHNGQFPTNMKDVWEDHWGALLSKKSAATPAVVLGEWGGPVSGDNGKWMNALADYLTAKGATSNFFWALNMDGTPKGIITSWTTSPPTLDQPKLALLERIVPHPTNVSALAGGLARRRAQR
jgi:endoglucanase